MEPQHVDVDLAGVEHELVEPDALSTGAALERIAAELIGIGRELRRPLRTLNRRLRLTAADNPVDLTAQEGFPLGSILIENPNAVTVHVGFGAGRGRPEQADRVVPPKTGVMIVQRFETVSIGVAAGDVGAGLDVFVTRYDRPQQAHAYAFAL